MVREKIIEVIRQDKRFKKEVELAGDIIYSLWVDNFSCVGNTSLSEIIERLEAEKKGGYNGKV
jgi:hypothetical protein